VSTKTNRTGPLLHRGWASIAGIIVAVVVAFVTILIGYNAEGGITNGDGVGQTSEPGLIANLDLQALDPLKHEATFTIAFGAQGDQHLDEQGRLTANTRVTVTSISGSQEVKYVAGEPVGKLVVSVPVDGEYANYPFDKYSTNFDVVVDTWVKGSDGSISSVADIPVGFQAVGGAYGWDSDATLPSGISTESEIAFNFTRAFSSQVFAFVLLGLAVVVSTLALIVTYLVYTNRRKLEITFLPWMAGLLFALPLLRSYLPSSPPIGAAIDIFVYLWTIVATVISLVLVVATWARRDRRSVEAELDRQERERQHAS
jgi:hypothetical protein